MRFVFLGPPGAGKGTQAVRVCEAHGLVHVSTGDLLRGEVAEGSPVGREAKGYMNRGELVPDAVVVKMVKGRLARPDASEGWVLDGFPRNLAQAEALDAVLGEGEAIDSVFYFDLPDDAVVTRLSGRTTCRDCGRVYSPTAVRPRAQGRCDACGGELYQRDDDQKETVLQRLQVFREQTADLVKYYEDQGRLIRIEAEGTPDEVAESLRQEIRLEA